MKRHQLKRVQSIPERFDAIEFLDYLRSRSLLIAACCVLAVLLAFGVSLALPKRYTATSTILIEAPAGNDPRASTAVSQVYLDSLKTYESFAASDTLFQQALEHLHLVGAKSNVLRVSKLPNTSILQINATWSDPGQAQALAQYIAEQTVAMGTSMQTRSMDNLLKGVREETAAALDAWKTARRQRDAFVASNPIEPLENEISNASQFGSELDRDLELAKADLAEISAQQSSAAQTAGPRARVAEFEKQRRELTDRIGNLGAQLEARRIRRDALGNDEDIAHDAYDKLQTRLDDSRSSSDWRGQRLEIIDPGIVPAQPSYPNTRLNVAAALFAALVGSISFLVFRFSYARLVRESAERVYSLR